MDRRIQTEASPIPVGPGGAGVAHFAGFAFDLQRAELRGPDGAVIALRPKAERLLRLFLAAPDRLLSRDALMAGLWPATIVTDDSLVQCVSELRGLLGDRAQCLIRTMPRRGYRFDAAVRIEAPAAAPNPAAVTVGPGVAATVPPRRPRRPAAIAAGLALAALSVGLVCWWLAGGLAAQPRIDE